MKRMIVQMQTPVAELEYKTWEDACAWRCQSALVNIPPGLVQNPPTDKIRNYKTDDNSDTDSVAELEYKTGEDECAWEWFRIRRRT